MDIMVYYQTQRDLVNKVEQKSLQNQNIHCAWEHFSSGTFERSDGIFMYNYTVSHMAKKSWRRFGTTYNAW